MTGSGTAGAMDGWMDEDAFKIVLDTWDRIRFTDRDLCRVLTVYASPEACRSGKADPPAVGFRICMVRKTAPGAAPEHRPERCTALEFGDGICYDSMKGKQCLVRSISLDEVSCWPYLKIMPVENSYSDPGCLFARDPSPLGLWVGLVPEDREKLSGELEERT